MAVKVVRLRQKSRGKFLTKKASFNFLNITDTMAVSPSIERL